MKEDLSFPIGKMGDEELKGLDMGCLVKDFVFVGVRGMRRGQKKIIKGE